MASVVRLLLVQLVLAVCRLYSKVVNFEIVERRSLKSKLEVASLFLRIILFLTWFKMFLVEANLFQVLLSCSHTYFFEQLYYHTSPQF